MRKVLPIVLPITSYFHTLLYSFEFFLYLSLSSHRECWLSFFPFLVADNSGRDFEAVLEFVRSCGFILLGPERISSFPFRDYLQQNSDEISSNDLALNLVLRLVLVPVMVGGAGV